LGDSGKFYIFGIIAKKFWEKKFFRELLEKKRVIPIERAIEKNKIPETLNLSK
jgi:hypothetical protein